MVALVLADAVLEKFGGDSVAETARNVARLPRHPAGHADAARSWCSSGRPGSGKTTVGARLVAGRLGLASGTPTTTSRPRAGAPIADIFVDDGEERSARWSGPRSPTALAEHDGVLALGGGAVLDAGHPERLRRHAGRLPRRRHRGRGRADRLQPRPAAAARQPARAVAARSWSAAPALRGGRRGHGGHRRADAGRGRRRGRRAASEPLVTGPTADRVGRAARRSAPYDVVVGTALLGELPAPARRRRRAGRRGAPAGAGRPGGAGAARPARRRARGRCSPVPGRRGRQDASRSRPVCWTLLGRAGFTRSDAVVGARRRRDHRPGRLRGGHLAARRPVVHVPTTLLGHGRRGGRRQDRDQHRRGQEPGRRLPPAGRRAVRPRRTLATLPRGRLVSGLAEVVKAGLHRGPADPRARRGRPGGGPRPGRDRRCASWSSARCG